MSHVLLTRTLNFERTEEHNENDPEALNFLTPRDFKEQARTGAVFQIEDHAPHNKVSANASDAPKTVCHSGMFPAGITCGVIFLYFGHLVLWTHA
jgi:hypothetical protein